MIKKFLEWIGIKQKIDINSNGPLFFNETEVWWCAVGENVGVEISGKGEMFSRPVYVYRKLSKDGFLGIPLSTKLKNGTWYVEAEFQSKKININLAQTRVFSSKRMYEKMGELEEKDVQLIKTAFRRLY